MARFDYDDPLCPTLNGPRGLFLELVCAGCPGTDLGSDGLDEVIEIHVDDDRLLAMTSDGHLPAVELAEPVRSLLLPWVS